MEQKVANKNQNENKSNILKYWQDDLIHDYYINYYNNLSTKQLDLEFKKDIRNITNVLGKLSDSERKVFINFLSRLIEFYLNQKIEKEIDSSLSKLLKTL